MADSLGRGLESLIPDKQIDETAPPQAAPVSPAQSDAPAAVGASTATPAHSFQDHFIPKRGESIFWIDIDKIDPNPFQPRREFDEGALKDLAGSIREHGILQPILVTKRDIETPTGLEVRYQLIAGERRMRASRLAGLTQVPAIIRRGIPDDKIRLELALIENVQREELNAMERARAFKQLVDEFHMVQREIGLRIGKSREAVANTLRLLTLPIEAQDALMRGAISEGHARAMLMAGDDPSRQTALMQEIISNGLNVREAENKARQISGKTLIPRKRPAKIMDPQMRDWQSRLEERLGTKVQLQRVGDRGKIVVEFYSDEELRGLLDKMMREV